MNGAAILSSGCHRASNDQIACPTSSALNDFFKNNIDYYNQHRGDHGIMYTRNTDDLNVGIRLGTLYNKPSYGLSVGNDNVDVGVDYSNGRLRYNANLHGDDIGVGVSHADGLTRYNLNGNFDNDNGSWSAGGYHSGGDWGVSAGLGWKFK